MITIASLFFIITIIHKGYTQESPQVPKNCSNETNMFQSQREDALKAHNLKRYYLATGTPFPNKSHIKFPKASDMNVLYYDCDLEISAYEIARNCSSAEPDFNYVGSNNETYNTSYFPFDFIEEAVNSWWKTALNDGTLVNLTPSEENRKMIPFLQMANGKTNKLGCAYHICDADYENYDETGDDSKGYLLFVCKYGDPHIKIGTPIYTEGEPCDSCKDRCTFNNALCDTKSSSVCQ